uniref:Geminin coiled-coil domain-containing protein 1 n=1 Tax=Scophthalmus maximus TaxID=52904 RepID=A0A8D3BK44_SCOMX
LQSLAPCWSDVGGGAVASPPEKQTVWTELISDTQLERSSGRRWCGGESGRSLMCVWCVLQLQDALLQREEELLRLQDENNELREFLSSSFVRNLEEKAKKLVAGGRRRLKRNHDGSLHNRGPRLAASKRVCRNLTAEFCSESSEPDLDLWVLRTLGLKDRDTIDTSRGSLDSGLGSFVYDAAVTSSSSSGLTLDSSSCSRQTEPGSGAAEGPEANCGAPAQSCTSPPGRRSDVTAAALSRRHDAPEDRDAFAAFQPPASFPLSPDRAEICSSTGRAPTQRKPGPPGLLVVGGGRPDTVQSIRRKDSSLSRGVFQSSPEQTLDACRPLARMSFTCPRPVQHVNPPPGQAFPQGHTGFTWLPNP